MTQPARQAARAGIVPPMTTTEAATHAARNTCPCGCGTALAGSQVLASPCWARVPDELREQLRLAHETYLKAVASRTRGITAPARTAYQGARRAVLAWVEANPAPAPTKAKRRRAPSKKRAT